MRRITMSIPMLLAGIILAGCGGKADLNASYGDAEGAATGVGQPVVKAGVFGNPKWHILERSVSACFSRHGFDDYSARGDEEVPDEGAFSGQPYPGDGPDHAGQWDFPPFSYSRAPEGWISLHLGQAQTVWMMFYTTSLEAQRTGDDPFPSNSGAMYRRANVLTWYDHEPTADERNQAGSCLP